MSDYVRRFTLRQIIQHFCVMVLFILLALTGFPQKFSEGDWARWIIQTLGGIDQTRWLHRYSGILFAALVAVHIQSEIFRLVLRRASPAMVPTGKDFQDAVKMLRYYLGLSDEQARFGRYDYRQKFEYWGLVLGSVIMIATGFILYFPIAVTRFLPGELIPVAKIAHSNEGLLAFLVVITWHIFNAHLSPDSFPFDASIFTGKISREKMEKEHPLEYERMQELTRPAESSQDD
ncbi:MAG: cytochrome C [Acidobacteria bacterium RIFCSPLOWO2_12_FULL_54_10]|nr:MAG: cytochrome C [Acidobacteria bacterium RIFCSPLOWO2_12_FULL_54_10]